METTKKAPGSRGPRKGPQKGPQRRPGKVLNRIKGGPASVSKRSPRGACEGVPKVAKGGQRVPEGAHVGPRIRQ
jgi:hypothetical protein